MVRYTRLKDINIKENIGKRIFVIFMLRGSEIKTKKDGRTEYYNLSISDKGVTIKDVKWFNITDKDKKIISDGIVYEAAIDIQPYDMSSLGYSCTIYNIQMFDEDNSDFIDISDGVAKAYEVISNSLSDISGTVYGAIASNLIQKYWNKFSHWTAACSMHHDKVAGLMVHTAEVIEISVVIADKLNEIYGNQFIDLNLLIGSALIHDMGKCIELKVNTVTGDTKYSSDGLLESHLTNILCEIEIISKEEELGKYNEDETVGKIEEENIKLLKHCILSHHGRKEYGSPVTPAIQEASVLHYADTISSEMYRYKEEISKIEKGESTTLWTPSGAISFYRRIDDVN